MDAQPAESIPPKSWTKTPGTTKGRDKIMFGLHLTMYAKVSHMKHLTFDLEMTLVRQGGMWVRMQEAKDDA